MTADSHVTQIDPYWFGRPEQEVRAYVEARAEQWALVPGYRRYLWSDKGMISRASDGLIMKLKVNNSGYAKLNVTNDAGDRVTLLVAPMILLAHHPSFYGLAALPKGMETRHNPSVGDKLFNAYPEGIWPGTKLQNAADKGGQVPLHPCRNAPACPNMNHNAGKRCQDCLDAVGVEAAELLRLGMPSAKVAARFGNSESWIVKLARERGGYAGSNAEARLQRPSLRQRVQLVTRRGGDRL